MGMNPDTNTLEMLGIKPDADPADKAAQKQFQKMLESVEGQPLAVPRSMLVRPDGSSVPDHWAVFQMGEHVVIKNYTFKVAYMGEKAILFEPVGPVVLDDQKEHTDG